MDIVFFISILFGLLSTMLWSEIAAWTPTISGRLIKFAAMRTEERHRDRLAEEWSRHLEDTPGVVWKIGFALQCLISSQRLIRKTERIRKRIFDVLVSASFFIMCWPVLTLLSLAIRLFDKGGNAIVREAAWGKDGKIVYLFRFRQVGEKDVFGDRAEEGWASTFNTFLYRTSLETLPRMLNVLRGDLSLVGPLPVLKSTNFDISEIKHIVAVKPGVLGLSRSEKPIASFAEVEKYINTCSVRTDIKAIIDFVLWMLFPLRG